MLPVLQDFVVDRVVSNAVVADQRRSGTRWGRLYRYRHPGYPVNVGLVVLRLGRHAVEARGHGAPGLPEADAAPSRSGSHGTVDKDREKLRASEDVILLGRRRRGSCQALVANQYRLQQYLEL